MDDNKKSTTIWLRPSVISRMDGWLEADNCQSRSEFVDKALRFYMGYLGTEDNTTHAHHAPSGRRADFQSRRRLSSEAAQRMIVAFVEIHFSKKIVIALPPCLRYVVLAK